MNVISKEEAEKLFENFNKLFDLELENLSQKMNLEQPYLLNYFSENIDESFNSEEKDLFLFYALEVWYVLMQFIEPPSLIYKRTIIKARKELLKSYIRFDSKLGLENYIDKLCYDYPQSGFIKMVFEMIKIETKDNPMFREDILAKIFFHLKLMIECFEKVHFQSSLLDNSLSKIGIKL